MAPESMTDRQSPSPETQVTLSLRLSRFLGGMLAGGVVLLLPLSYFSAELSRVQVGAAGAIVLLFGVLSSVWGQKVIDPVLKNLDRTGL